MGPWADKWCLSQIVDKTMMEADLDRDGKISFDEFTKMVENTDVSMSMTLGMSIFSPSSHPPRLCTSQLLPKPYIRSRKPAQKADLLIPSQNKSDDRYPTNGFCFSERIT